MKRLPTLIIVFIIVLLVAGWVLFRVVNSGDLVLEESGFRTWFWEKRGLDLVVQIVLVFAGALGIAAILPDEEEND